MENLQGKISKPLVAGALYFYATPTSTRLQENYVYGTQAFSLESIAFMTGFATNFATKGIPVLAALYELSRGEFQRAGLYIGGLLLLNATTNSLSLLYEYKKYRNRRISET